MKSPYQAGLRRRSLPRAIGVSLAALMIAMVALTGCSADPTAKTEITVAIVSNPQMKDAISLQDDFRKAHPNVNVKFVSLPENEARAKITVSVVSVASVATGGGDFDVVMISNYETEMWAKTAGSLTCSPMQTRPPGTIPTISSRQSRMR
ncbi:extracellular solute-binding protein [Renibacterium salmoninarum]|nr:extracellular solute-binding protein [Renibacterium salmoninarum]